MYTQPVTAFLRERSVDDEAKLRVGRETEGIKETIVTRTETIPGEIRRETLPATTLAGTTMWRETAGIAMEPSIIVQEQPKRIVLEEAPATIHVTQHRGCCWKRLLLASS
jgi:hypothetical protein